MVPLPDEITHFVESEYGDKAKSVLDALEAMGRATDTDLSELLEERPSHIRKVLYALYEARLADYEEHREPGTGWLTFVWTLTPEQGQRALDGARQEHVNELKEAIAAERNTEFYACPDGHIRLGFGDAMDDEFKCYACGKMLEYEEHSARLDALLTELQDFEKGQA